MDYSRFDNSMFQSFFGGAITTGNYETVKEMFSDPRLTSKINSDRTILYEAFYKVAISKNVKMLELLYDYMKDNEYDFEDELLTKTFNKICANNSVSCLKFLDSRINLSSSMMEHKEVINIKEHTWSKPTFNPTGMTTSYSVLKRHGFINAVSVSNEELAFYLLSQPKIHQSVLESGFILALERKNFNIALRIYEYTNNTPLQTIKNSQEIHEYLYARVSDEEIKSFIEKINLKSKLDSLVKIPVENNQSSIKRTKV